MSTTVATETKCGALTIAGSGIASVAHITLETLSHIKEADKVYYIVCDPLTEAFIQDNATGTCFNFSVFYDEHKSRYDSYVQMCEVMLRDVRAGHDVLGIFYGHPGVFVSPSHRAIALAREEGYKARMLPGVSAEDYMFADLEFDPSQYGCMTCEATEVLLRDRPLNPSVHNIIWQVGGVGIATTEFNNSKFHLLVDRLEKDFGPDHEVVHYIGAILPQSATTTDAYTIADLRKEDVVKQFSVLSTLYVPPRDIIPANASMAGILGAPSAPLKLLRATTRWAGPKLTYSDAYGPRERKAVAQIDVHVPPEESRILHASLAMRKFMTDLALRPKLLEKYKADPPAVVEAAEGLTARERFALNTGKPGPVYALMSTTRSDIANGRELTEDELTQAVGPSGSIITLNSVIAII